jgi:hypothetical protein
MYFQLTPTSTSPIFDHYGSALFSITNNRIVNPSPKTQHLILKCCPPHKVVHNFHNAVAQGQHAEIPPLLLFLCAHVVLQSENQATQKR